MTLRDQSLRGGAYLTVRQGVGVAVRLFGVLALTRLIGPADFGLYAGSLAVVALLATVAQLGSEAYLVRLPGDVDDEVYDHTFTFLAVSSAVVTSAGLLAALGIRLVAGETDFVVPLMVMMLTIPINVLWAPAQARIERGFQYRRMALLEVGGDLALYGVSVPLAWIGLGVWAPVTGYFAFQAWLLVGSYVIARHRPRLAWSTVRVRHIVRFGIGFSLAGWLRASTELVNPIVVGRHLGSVGVGQVALIIRLVDTLGFVLRVTQRLAMVAFGRVQGDLPRLRRAVEESIALQLLTLGPFLAGFALVADGAIPLLFGEEWSPAVSVYPAYAMAFFLQSAFFVQVYVLQVLERNAAVVKAGVVHLVTLAGCSLVIVPVIGIAGYGAAYLIATCAWWIVRREIRRIMPVSAARSVPWVIAVTPALLAPYLDWPWRAALVVPAMVVLALPAPRADIRGYVTDLTRMGSGARQVATES